MISFAAALIAYRYTKFEPPFANVSALFYTIPSIALFQIMVPLTGIGRLTIEIALVSYTLLILFRNTLDRAPTRCPRKPKRRPRAWA